MGPVIAVGDAQDDRLDDYRNLTDAELRQREEPPAGLFMVEGPALIRVLVRSAYPVRSLLLTEARLAELGPDLADSTGDFPVFVAANDVMRAVTGFHFHRGALACAGRRPQPAWAEVVEGAALTLVVEDVGDHENIGALFRNAAAFGAGAVLLSPGSVDPLYRRAVRVSMGQVLRVPWARALPWPGMVASLKARGFRVLALTPDPGTAPLATVAGASKPTAVLVGTEGRGLTAAARALADAEARIPMRRGVDSLNVATAAAVALYELTR
ncbi:MAG: TrmH family RNA methyltransferase [Acidimicrobiales bacterium]